MNESSIRDLWSRHLAAWIQYKGPTSETFVPPRVRLGNADRAGQAYHLIWFGWETGREFAHHRRADTEK